MGGERVLLHFEAVDEQGELWVNGRWMGRREGGYTRQSWDITDAIGTGGEAELILRAYDDPHDLHKPRGKQDWLEHPHSIWYPRTTGIWQSVWLETVSAVRIENLRWSCSLERYEIGLEVSLAGRVSKGSLLRVRLISRGEVLVDDSIGVCGRELSRAFRLPDPGIESARHELLWSPEHPNLIDAEISLEDAAGEILDEVGSYPASHAIDGNTSTRWSPAGISKPQWLEIDLGSEYEVNRIQILFRSARSCVRDPHRIHPDMGHIDQFYHYKIEYLPYGDFRRFYADRTDETFVAYSYIEHGEAPARFVHLTITECTSYNPNKNVYQIKIFGSPQSF